MGFAPASHTVAAPVTSKSCRPFAVAGSVDSTVGSAAAARAVPVVYVMTSASAGLTPTAEQVCRQPVWSRLRVADWTVDPTGIPDRSALMPETHALAPSVPAFSEPAVAGMSAVDVSATTAVNDVSATVTGCVVGVGVGVGVGVVESVNGSRIGMVGGAGLHADES